MRSRIVLIIAIRLMGLWFSITGACSLIAAAASTLLEYNRTMPLFTKGLAPAPPGFFESLPMLSIAQLISGLLLVFGASWLARELDPHRGNQCLNCGYDLSHSKGLRCPECGGPNDFAAPAPSSSSSTK